MKFTRYQIFVVAVLAFLQFTIILDFMILSPLGAMLLEELKIPTTKFGLVVSVYAFSAGVSGLLTAGFADKFDRKKLLLFFYTGFILGTVLCGIASNYHFLLIARIVTGLFGGVIGSITMAITADLFALEMRGRVMGIVQTAFAASQVMGLPMGLFLSNHWGWHAPFLMIAGIGTAVGVVIAIGLKPIDAHLKIKNDRNAFEHLFKTVLRPNYLRAFAATVVLATGGFMLMPFGSTFTVHNLGISMDKLPMIYMVTGTCAIIAGPLIGRLSDAIGKYPVFFMGSVLGMIMVVIYCNLGITPLWAVILVSVLLFIAISARMISISALISAVPDMKDRGAFMSVNASTQQFAGGIASALAGLIVVQNQSGKLERYGLLGYVVVCAMLVTLGLMYSIHKMVQAKAKAMPTAEAAGKEAVPASTGR
ncbi:MFS transporter [Pedosphaera parvula]|uniref:Major facilitator superfamily MFS_1 n=1 Tax=Pedosphaera parvula (strain Ellin514) TaxID=320771 RepID=B9XK73_PEDPL|nr:MFS transporter [Pedosphaera parvula]EEF59711.1 major facilitator superfamily MFS_1 [Pedosphaera parvula Ellin514]